MSGKPDLGVGWIYYLGQWISIDFHVLLPRTIFYSLTERDSELLLLLINP